MNERLMVELNDIGLLVDRLDEHLLANKARIDKDDLKSVSTIEEKFRATNVEQLRSRKGRFKCYGWQSNISILKNQKIFPFILCLGILVSCTPNKSNIKQINSTYPELKINYDTFYMASTSNNKMYLPVADDSKERLPNKILSYNLSNKAEETVFHSKMGSDANIQGVHVNEKWLLWNDTNAVGSKTVLYGKNLSNNKQNKIHKTNEIIEPYLYKHYVSWMEINDQKKNAAIILYDLETNTQTQIATVNSYDTASTILHMNEDKLIYTNSNEKQTTISIYNLKSKHTSTYLVPQNNVLAPRIVGDKIVYVSLSIDEKNTNTQIENYFILDINSKQLTPLSIEGVNNKQGETIGSLSATMNYWAFTTDDQKVWVYQFNKEGYKKIKLDIPNVFQLRMSENGDTNIICDNPDTFPEKVHDSIVSVSYAKLKAKFQNEKTESYIK
ncbi:hypothetical protein [Bacillus mycoides]|uniref:hypothetical protein n=4 Tax=Bacillus mycoides TaxID=1405 RepID=UPI00065BEB0B|nr:hypothetical protein [Bacillus mycoides]KMQ16302.1 hypothetical protein TU70_16065 [Bacillus mycoides]OSY03376.1 hypothetical protein BTJ44_05314 [Bacillus mycoides]QWG42287.1 hypothetical protein EXW35_28540 [Bacillus mycoides]QWI41104.1 hypothetical protein EXW43_29120 [Bacillus mycoides]